MLTEGSARTGLQPASLLVALLSIVAALAVIESIAPRGADHGHLGVVALGLLGAVAGVLAWVRPERAREGGRLALAVAIAAVGSAWVLAALHVERWALWLADGALSLYGQISGAAHSVDGVVLRHPAGNAEMTAERGLTAAGDALALVAIAVMFTLRRQLSLHAAVAFAVAVLVGLLVEIHVTVLAFMNDARPFQLEHPAPTLRKELIAWRAIPLILPAMVLAHALARRSSGSSLRPAPLHMVALALAAAAILVPGPPLEVDGRRPRVLVDDAHAGQWNPGTRLCTEEWFGDFSTYGFSSAVEALGYSFDVTVNSDGVLRSALLKEYDVVVLKTPTQDFTKEEVRDLREFVTQGGGLVAISDHTDLLGMSSRLNEVMAGSGLKFRSDSVLDGARGGYTLWTPHRTVLGGELRVPAVEFMTGASIELRGSSRSLMTGRYQVSQKADWGNNSGFGATIGELDRPSGRVSLAAEGRLGAGSVVAFGDSTILSGFACFYPGRFEMLVALVERAAAGDRARRIESGRRWLALASGLFVGAVLPTTALGSLVSLAMLLVLAFGHQATHSDVTRAGAGPLPEIAVVTHVTDLPLPPVIGSLPEGITVDRAYDALIAALPRYGVFPRLVPDVKRAIEAKVGAILLVNPAFAPEPEELAGLRSFVDSGGTLVLGTELARVRVDTLAAHAATFGWKLQLDGGGRVSVDGPGESGFDDDHFMVRRPFGDGQVILVGGCENWTRGGLGHCFSRPGPEERRNYSRLRDLLEACPGLIPEDRRTYGIACAYAE